MEQSCCPVSAREGTGRAPNYSQFHADLAATPASCCRLPIVAGTDAGGSGDDSPKRIDSKRARDDPLVNWRGAAQSCKWKRPDCGQGQCVGVGLGVELRDAGKEFDRARFKRFPAEVCRRARAGNAAGRAFKITNFSIERQGQRRKRSQVKGNARLTIDGMAALCVNGVALFVHCFASRKAAHKTGFYFGRIPAATVDEYQAVFLGNTLGTAGPQGTGSPMAVWHIHSGNPARPDMPISLLDGC